MDKNIFQVNGDFNEYTIIVTDDLDNILDENIIKQLGKYSDIIIWNNGKQIKTICLDKEDLNYDSLYLKLIEFAN